MMVNQSPEMRAMVLGMYIVTVKMLSPGPVSPRTVCAMLQTLMEVGVRARMAQHVNVEERRV